MDAFINILLGIVATPICFGAGVLFRSAFAMVSEKRPAGKIWLVRAEQPVDIITSAPLGHKEESSDLVYPAEATAAAEVALFLRDTFKSQTRIGFSESHSEDALQNNLVVIGGPVHNELTRHFLNKLHIGNIVQGHSFVSPSGQKYSASSEQIFGQEKITEDYGLVVRAPNPYNKDKLVTLLIGSRTSGTLIAARSLIDPMVRPTAKKIHSGKSFYLIIGARIAGNQPGSLKLEESW